MTELAKLQSEFATFARQNMGISDHPKSFKAAQKIATGNARMTPCDQLDVYREQFFLRHVGSLREDFPTVEHLLGSAKFEKMCAEYLAAAPPRSFALRDASDRMGAFLKAASPYAGDPLLADCANVEWAFIEAFDAGDAPPLDVSLLAAIDEDAWDRAVLHFHPSMRFLDLSFPAHEFRTQVRNGEKPERPVARATRIVTFRSADDTLRWVEVEPAAFALLRALAEKKPLGEAGEVAAQIDPEVGEKIGTWFQAWTQNGFISKIEAPV